MTHRLMSVVKLFMFPWAMGRGRRVAGWIEQGRCRSRWVVGHWELFGEGKEQARRAAGSVHTYGESEGIGGSVRRQNNGRTLFRGRGRNGIGGREGSSVHHQRGERVVRSLDMSGVLMPPHVTCHGGPMHSLPARTSRVPRRSYCCSTLLPSPGPSYIHTYLCTSPTPKTKQQSVGTKHGGPGDEHRFLHAGHVHHWYVSPVAACIRDPSMAQDVSDEIEFPPPKPPVKDIVGGAGSYSALGARIFSPVPQSQSVGWIVDCGSDFPPELRDVIAHWRSGVLIRETPHRLTTRGWNGYGEHEHRGTK